MRLHCATDRGTCVWARRRSNRQPCGNGHDVAELGRGSEHCIRRFRLLAYSRTFATSPRAPCTTEVQATALYRAERRGPQSLRIHSIKRTNPLMGFAAVDEQSDMHDSASKVPNDLIYDQTIQSGAIQVADAYAIDPHGLSLKHYYQCKSGFVYDPATHNRVGHIEEGVIVLDS